MIQAYKIHTQGTLPRGTNQENFQLKRERQQLPIILGQPVDNVFQFEHLENELPAKVRPLNNTVGLLVGIGFSINILVLDPSNVEDPTDLTNLSYVWKYNGNEIYVANNANKGKGTNALRFSNDQSRIGLTGEYVCEVTNDYGTTTSATLNLEIIEPTLHKLYYRNLIYNGCGEAGLDGWITSDKVIVSEFVDNSMYTNTGNFATIGRGVPSTRGTDGELLETQPDIPFRFSKDSNWANLERFFQDTDFAKTYGGFIWKKIKPNLIQNETPYDPFASFFPSLKYLDKYNKNENKNGLESAFNVSSTYFTRDEMGFEKDNEAQTVQLTQTIDLTDYANHIDRHIVGINNIVGRFFCYIGLGLDKYEYEFIVSNMDTQEGTPAIANTDLWADIQQRYLPMGVMFPGITGGLNILDWLLRLYELAGGTYLNDITTSAGGPTPRYNTYLLSAESLKRLADGEAFDKLNMSGVTRINLIPKAHNNASVKITAIRDGLPSVELANIKGPTEEDLFTVKEMAFISYYLQNTFSRFTSIAQPTPVYYQNKKICSIGPGATQANSNFLNNKVSQYDQSDYNLQNSTTEALADPGVQAFFAVGENFSIPPKTRGLRITVLMNHDSKAYHNTSPQSGLVSWNQDTLYAEHLDNVDTNGAYIKASLPKIAVTQMKLSLYDNEYGRIPSQPTYFIPDYSIATNRKVVLRTWNLDDSTHGQSSYLFTPTPSAFYRQQ